MKLPPFIRILSRGQEIVFTNFWDTDLGMDTYAISEKSDCLRLLVPQCNNQEILDMVQCEYVIASRLKSIRPGRFVIELLFQDNSQSPFCIFMTAEACLGSFPQADNFITNKRELTIWTEGLHKVAELPLYIRYAPRLPWLKPLDD